MFPQRRTSERASERTSEFRRRRRRFFNTSTQLNNIGNERESAAKELVLARSQRRARLTRPLTPLALTITCPVPKNCDRVVSL